MRDIGSAPNFTEGPPVSVTLRRLAIVTVSALVATAVQAPAARAEGPEQIVNGTFDSGATAP
jgi:hypothetical protein